MTPRILVACSSPSRLTGKIPVVTYTHSHKADAKALIGGKSCEEAHLYSCQGNLCQLQVLHILIACSKCDWPSSKHQMLEENQKYRQKASKLKRKEEKKETVHINPVCFFLPWVEIEQFDLKTEFMFWGKIIAKFQWTPFSQETLIILMTSLVPFKPPN